MSDIFENDIDKENVNLSSLEDGESGESLEQFEFEGPLY